MLIGALMHPGALAPAAIGGVIVWIVARRLMVRSLTRKGRDQARPGDSMREMWPDREKPDSPPPRSRVTRRQLRYARELLDEDRRGGKSGD